MLVYNVSCKSPADPKLLPIRFDKTDGFIISLDCKIRRLVLFHYGLLDKICDKIEYPISKKVVLQIVLIIILKRLELIDIYLYLLKKY